MTYNWILISFRRARPGVNEPRGQKLFDIFPLIVKPRPAMPLTRRAVSKSPDCCRIYFCFKGHVILCFSFSYIYIYGQLNNDEGKNGRKNRDECLLYFIRVCVPVNNAPRLIPFFSSSSHSFLSFTLRGALKNSFNFVPYRYAFT